MGSRLTGAFVGSALVAGLALAAREAPAQLTDQPATGLPPIGATSPQPAPLNGTVAPPSSPPPPRIVNAAPATNATATVNEAGSKPAAATPPPPPKPPPPPPGPPLPARTPTAVMQVLDKVTAETLQFEAPIGRPIRYKTLVMTVRVCETRGAQDPQPRPSAYVVMDTQAPVVPDHEPPPPKRVFDGWMFANAPALHPLEHPIYDAWLVSCTAGTPIVRPTPPPTPVPVPAKPPAAKPPGPTSPVSGSTGKPPIAKPPAVKPPPPLPPAPAPENAPSDNSSTPPQ